MAIAVVDPKLSCGYLEVPRTRERIDPRTDAKVTEVIVSRGTAYLVAPNMAVTCAHVVQSRYGREDDPTLDPMIIRFEGERVAATIEAIDVNRDVAVLRLARALDRPPLKLAARPPLDMLVWTTCASMGSDSAPTAGPTLEIMGGVLAATQAADKYGTPLLTLVGPQTAEAAAKPGNAMAGAPVLVRGRVVGHLRDAVHHPASRELPLAGLVSAVPGGVVREVLDLEGWPERATNPYHAFVSIKEADREWAEDLQEELQLAGLRLYVASHEMDASTELSAAEKEALDGVRMAVVVYSQAWTADDTNVEETQPLRSEDRTFDTVVVRLDAASVPAPYDAYPEFVFKSNERPDGAELHRLKERLITGANPEAAGHAEVWKTIEAASKQIANEMKEVSSAGVVAFAKRWQDAGMPDEYIPRKAARELTDAGRPDLALEVLASTARSPRVQRLRALALSKNGQNAEAVGLLETLVSQGQADARTLARLAGRYKQQWLDTGRNRDWLLHKTHDTYAKANEVQPSAYHSINVASMALLMGDRERARALALKVLGMLEQKSKLDVWDMAMVGEAHLLWGNFSEAVKGYKEAALLEPDDYANLASMAQQARLILETFPDDYPGLEGVRSELARAFYAPRVVGFAGPRLNEGPGSPFAPNRERYLAARLREMVRKHDVGLGLCTLLDGCDVLFAEAVLEYGGSVEALIPFPLNAFRELVIDPTWRARLDVVAANAVVKPVRDTVPAQDQMDAALDAALGRVVDATIARAASRGVEPVFITAMDSPPAPSSRGAKAAMTWVDERGPDGLERVAVRPAKMTAPGLGGSTPRPIPRPTPPPPARPSDDEAEGDSEDDADDDPDRPGGGRPAESKNGEADAAVESRPSRPSVDPTEFRHRALTPAGGATPPSPGPDLAEGEYGQRHCLVIGIDLYDEWSPLGNAVADAKGFAKTLTETVGFDTVKVVLDGDATNLGIREAIVDDMVSLVKEDDLFVLFFAGHGHTKLSAGGDIGYLVPVEARRSKDADLLPLAQVVGWVRQLSSRHVLFVFDSCFSGHATMDLGVSMGGRRPGDAREVITAGTAEQVVLDGGGEGHSVFTGALLEGMGGPASRRADGRFTATQLYDYVADAVRERTQRSQTPSRGNLPGHGGGRIWFGS